MLPDGMRFTRQKGFIHLQIIGFQCNPIHQCLVTGIEFDNIILNYLGLIDDDLRSVPDHSDLWPKQQGDLVQPAFGLGFLDGGDDDVHDDDTGCSKSVPVFSEYEQDGAHGEQYQVEGSERVLDEDILVRTADYWLDRVDLTAILTFFDLCIRQSLQFHSTAMIFLVYSRTFTEKSHEACRHVPWNGIPRLFSRYPRTTSFQS